MSPPSSKRRSWQRNLILGVAASLIAAGIWWLFFGQGSPSDSQIASVRDGGCNVVNSVNNGSLTCNNTPPKTPPQLSATIRVRNGATRATGDPLQYTPETQPVIYVTVRNDGDAGVAVDNRRLVVEYVADLDGCEPSGGAEIESWPDGFSFPPDIAAGDKVEGSSSSAYEIRGDDSGRFALSVRPINWGALRKLVRLRVELRTVSDGQWWDAGSAVLSLPGAREDEFIRTAHSVYPEDDGSAGSQALGDCLSGNRDKLRIALGSGHAAASSELLAVT